MNIVLPKQLSSRTSFTDEDEFLDTADGKVSKN